MRTKVKHPYYNFDKVLSFNAVFNFVLGGRGLGKTYGAKKKAIWKWAKTGEEFIYVRRFKPELKSATTFLDDLIANDDLPPEFDFRVNGLRLEGSGVEFRNDKKREWRTVGYFVSLSTAQSQKSIAYPRVTLIIFDEFILEKGFTQYIPDEATVFQNFYSTVDRWQDKTRVLFLANSVSINNPYFLQYKIRPDADTEWWKAMKGFIVCHFAKSEDFQASVMATKFGQFIADTDYANYAVGNEFRDNNDHLLQVKNDRARYQYTLITNEGAFSVWRDPYSNNFYCQEKRPGIELVFVTEPSLMEEGRTLLLRNNKLLQYLRSAFSGGSLYFDLPSTRNSMIEIFKR